MKAIWKTRSLHRRWFGPRKKGQADSRCHLLNSDHSLPLLLTHHSMTHLHNLHPSRSQMSRDSKLVCPELCGLSFRRWNTSSQQSTAGSTVILRTWPGWHSKNWRRREIFALSMARFTFHMACPCWTKESRMKRWLMWIDWAMCARTGQWQNVSTELDLRSRFR